VTETNDPRAVVATTRQIGDLLQAVDDTFDLEWSTDRERLAEVVLAGFTVRYETRDGLRRPVLYGPWEVDPVALRRPVPVGGTGG
jgi:hypothetical protein